MQKRGDLDAFALINRLVIKSVDVLPYEMET